MATIFVLATVILVPLAIYGWWRQHCQWQVALAMNEYLQNDSHLALARLDRIGDQCRHLPIVQATWARWLADADRAIDGMTIVDAALETHPADVHLLLARIHCLDQLQRHEESLATYREFLEVQPVSERNRMYRVMRLAYRRALSGRELFAALIDSQSLLVEAEQQLSTRSPVSLETHILLWSAILAVETGQIPEVVEQLSTAVDERQRRLRDWDASYSLQMYRFARLPWPLANREFQDLRQLRQQRDRMIRELAMLCAARAFLFDRQGVAAGRDADRVLALQLGFDPDQLLAEIPGSARCIDLLRIIASLLKTSGLVNQRVGRTTEGLRHMNLAIDAQRTFLSAVNYLPWGNNESTADPRVLSYYYERFGPRSLAIMLQHRATALRDASRYVEAERDEIEIRRMGYHPGPHLF